MNKPKSELNKWSRILHSYTYYLNSNGDVQYLTKFDYPVTKNTISYYRDLFWPLKGDSLQHCILAIESEAKRFDTFIPLINPIGLGLISIILSFIFEDIPIYWLAKLLIFGGYIVFIIITFTRSIRSDSIKRTHIDLMLSLLKQKADLE